MALEQTPPELLAAAPPFLQAFTHFPDRWSDPYALVAGALAAGSLGIYAWVKGDPKKIEGFAHEPSNPGAARQAVTEVTTGEDRNTEVRDRWYRMGAPLVTGLGLITLTAAALTGPSFTTTQVDNNPNTAIALENSFTFDNTFDMPKGQSRFHFVRSSLADSEFSGNMSVTEFGYNAQPAQALEAFSKRTFLSNVSESVVSTDGNDVYDGINSATGTLPNHTGNLIVFTDGFGAEYSSTSSVASEVNKLNKEGINTKIVVVGTAGAKYSINHSAKTPDAPDESVFNGVNPSDIVTANTPDTIKAQIQGVVGKPVKTEKQNFWYPLLIPGAVLSVIGLIRDFRQRKNKVI